MTYMNKRYRLPIRQANIYTDIFQNPQSRQPKSNFNVFFSSYLITASPHPASSSSLSKERRGGTTAEDEDYDYDDDDEPSKEMGTNDVNGGGGGVDQNTMLLTRNHTVETEINDTVTLPCRVNNPQSEFFF